MSDFEKLKLPASPGVRTKRDQVERWWALLAQRAMVCCVISTLVATACAAHPNVTEGIGPHWTDRIAEICRSTMGLEPGEAQFDFCVGSLTREVLGQIEASGMVAARQVCLDRRLAPGSPALAACELQTSRRMPTSETYQPFSTDVPVAPTSFFHTTPDEAFHRAQVSCAALGLEPISEAFASCVANLNASMQPEPSEG